MVISFTLYLKALLDRAFPNIGFSLTIRLFKTAVIFLNINKSLI